MDASADAARLTARPGAPPSVPSAPTPGMHVLHLGPGPEVLVRVPAPAPDGPPRLVLALPGAGGNARGGLAPLLPTASMGRPPVYISHGRNDTVLPIGPTTRRIAARLRAADVPTDVHEFDGPRVVPPDIAEHAARWLPRR